MSGCGRLAMTVPTTTSSLPVCRASNATMAATTAMNRVAPSRSMSNELTFTLPLRGSGQTAVADSTPGIARSRKLLFELLDQKRAEGFPTEETTFGGFSQGCLMTWEVGLTYPHLFAGLLGISVMRLMAVSGMKSQLTTSPNTSFIRTPFR